METYIKVSNNVAAYKYLSTDSERNGVMQTVMSDFPNYTFSCKELVICFSKQQLNSRLFARENVCIVCFCKPKRRISKDVMVRKISQHLLDLKH